MFRTTHRRSMRVLAVTVLASAALAPLAMSTASSGAVVKAEEFSFADELPQRGNAGTGTATTSPNLVDNGGIIMPAARMYAIYWGTGTTGGLNFPAAYTTPVNAFLNGLGATAGTGLLGVTDQYMRGGKASTTFVKTYYDTKNSLPKSAPSVSAIVAEAGRAVAAAGDAIDPGAMYIVFTANFPNQRQYCAWHSAGTVNGQWITVAYMPNVTGVSGCQSPDAGSGVPQGIQSLINVTSHEILEVTTDTMIGNSRAWLDSAGAEIADKCAWKYASSNGAYVKQAIGGYNWILQQEWSNAVTGCV